MTVKKNQQIELEIKDLAFGGKGIAKVDGFAVFVAQTAPSDRVLAQVIRKKKSYAEARVLKYLHRSSLRVDPPCPYSGICGGCTWQFLDYSAQLEVKQRHVGEALSHIGGIEDALIHPTLPSEKRFGYRNKMEFSCADRRWRLPEEMDDAPADADFALGLHVPGTFYKVLDIEACLLQPDLGNRILNDVKTHIRQSPLSPYGLSSHEGFWRFLMLRHSQAHDSWMVNIVTAYEDMGEVRPLAGFLKDKYPQVVCVTNNITSRKSGVAAGEYEIHLEGEKCLRERLGPYEFEISSNSFFQTNTLGAQRLYDTVKKFARLSGRESVLDLYSGTGTIPIWLSDAAAQVIGIEIVADAVSDARKNCDTNGVTNCSFIAGDIRQTIDSVEKRPDRLIIDPPRTGMHPDVAAKVMEMAPPRIVYVSCNPATLARDAALLKERYRLVEVQPVDMFPHTYHIEAVAAFDLR